MWERERKTGTHFGNVSLSSHTGYWSVIWIHFWSKISVYINIQANILRVSLWTSKIIRIAVGSPLTDVQLTVGGAKYHCCFLFAMKANWNMRCHVCVWFSQIKLGGIFYSYQSKEEWLDWICQSPLNHAVIHACDTNGGGLRHDGNKQTGSPRWWERCVRLKPMYLLWDCREKWGAKSLAEGRKQLNAHCRCGVTSVNAD